MAEPGPGAPLALSVVLVAYNMQRAVPNTVRSLLPPYQRDIDPAAYEILVLENGSTRALDARQLESLAPNVRHIRVENASVSPARALNLGLAQARGSAVCLMVDGAHLLTPRVLATALEMFRALPAPLVLTPAFFLGPGPQTVTVAEGYDERAEDALLEGIDWPHGDGYRLFEIGVPYRIEPGGKRPPLYWFVRQFESNCLFAPRALLERIGGCDERFDLPGGGWLMPDLYRRLADCAEAEIVQLLGEASFHQVHGGISTNTSPERQRELLARFHAQYEAIRGKPYEVTQKPLRFHGHMPNRQARQLMITG